MSVVELTEAVAVLGSFPALAGASITIDEGEIVLLRGPNGAGKTTLLRLCAGLVPIVRGTGHILGFDLPRNAKRSVSTSACWVTRTGCIST